MAIVVKTVPCPNGAIFVVEKSNNDKTIILC